MLRASVVEPCPCCVAAEVGAGFSLAHAATASLLACVTVLTILQTESKGTAALRLRYLSAYALRLV